MPKELKIWYNRGYVQSVRHRQWGSYNWPSNKHYDWAASGREWVYWWILLGCRGWRGSNTDWIRIDIPCTKQCIERGAIIYIEPCSKTVYRLWSHILLVRNWPDRELIERYQVQLMLVTGHKSIKRISSQIRESIALSNDWDLFKSSRKPL